MIHIHLRKMHYYNKDRNFMPNNKKVKLKYQNNYKKQFIRRIYQVKVKNKNKDKDNQCNYHL